MVLHKHLEFVFEIEGKNHFGIPKSPGEKQGFSQGTTSENRMLVDQGKTIQSQECPDFQNIPDLSGSNGLGPMPVSSETFDELSAPLVHTNLPEKKAKGPLVHTKFPSNSYEPMAPNLSESSGLHRYRSIECSSLKNCLLKELKARG